MTRLHTIHHGVGLLKFHLDDVGSAAGRAAELADPDQPVSTRGQVLTTGGYLDAYVLEWTLHHLDLIAHLPAAVEPSASGLARSRDLLGRIIGSPLPPSWSNKNALLVGTGRRAPTRPEAADLGTLADAAPVFLG